MSSSAALAERQALFTTSYLPTITDRLAFRFRSLAPEAKAEAIQDVTATAWASFSRVAEAGRAWDGQAQDRTGCATPSSIAGFAANHYGEGRGFLGTCVTDPLAPACQRLGRVQLRHLGDRKTGTASADSVPVALVTRAHANPAARVRVSEDWKTISARCTPQARSVLALLVRGWKPRRDRTPSGRESDTGHAAQGAHRRGRHVARLRPAVMARDSPPPAAMRRRWVTWHRMESACSISSPSRLPLMSSPRVDTRMHWPRWRAAARRSSSSLPPSSPRWLSARSFSERHRHRGADSPSTTCAGRRLRTTTRRSYGQTALCRARDVHDLPRHGHRPAPLRPQAGHLGAHPRWRP